jgi:tetratricopeptide (TPR) repeat protein
MSTRRVLLALALSALPAARAAAHASLPWRHLDDRLTLGLNPALAVFRGDPSAVPEAPLGDEERTLIVLLRENPGNAGAQLRLADLELRKGLRARAAERFLHVARLDGANREALSGLTVCLLADNSLDPAVKLLEEMKRKGLAGERDRFNLAWAQLQRGRAELALTELQALLPTLEAAPSPDRVALAAVCFNLAGLSLGLDRPEAAQDYLRAVRRWEQGE